MWSACGWFLSVKRERDFTMKSPETEIEIERERGTEKRAVEMED